MASALAAVLDLRIHHSGIVFYQGTRNALARAPSLWAVTDLDRSELPWVEWEEREERILGGTKR